MFFNSHVFSGFCVFQCRFWASALGRGATGSLGRRAGGTGCGHAFGFGWAE